MTATGAAKRKALDAEFPEGEACPKIARTNCCHHENSNNNDNIVVGADPWSRVAATLGMGDSAAAGRGSLSGWTLCPLCGVYSKKKHALGRGIANHLKDVHTPWNPGKMAQKIHRRQHERRERERERSKKLQRPKEEEASLALTPLASWTPTEEDKKEWAATILEILQKIVEERATLPSAVSEITSSVRESKEISSSKEESEKKQKQSEDKSGKLAIAYRDSLPPFLTAAMKGDLAKLQELVEEAKVKDKENPATLSVSSKTGETIQNNGIEETIHNHYHLRTLLNKRDRHKSTADHWAAGGGHLDCLRYLYNLRPTLRYLDNRNTEGTRQQLTQRDLDGSSSGGSKIHSKARRRDGKTCLHYASRNGHVDCIRYLLEPGPSDRQPAHENYHHTAQHTVDERSGEGTTPLHLACYGGHPDAVRYLVEAQGADPHTTNDWGCTCAHWAAMTLSCSEVAVRDLCGYLSDKCSVSFAETQGQGHTALHKAASKRNQHVIRWMADSKSDGGAGLEPTDKEKAGVADRGGHKPSDIWRNMGGDAAFAEWMRITMGW